MRIRMIDPTYSDNATTARMSEIAPEVSDDGTHITAQEGENMRRSWGCVKTTSTVVIKTRTFCVVHVGVAHKYGGGQQWYYFERKPDAPIRRLTASKLSARRRKQVLEAFNTGKAPRWAKKPFVETRKKAEPPKRYIRYKAVAVVDGEYRSIFDDSVYEIGKTRREKVQADHNGGFYVYSRPEYAKNAEVPTKSVNYDAPRAILKCEVWGNHEFYGERIYDPELNKHYYESDSKQAWTYLRPVANMPIQNSHSDSINIACGSLDKPIAVVE